MAILTHLTHLITLTLLTLLSSWTQAYTKLSSPSLKALPNPASDFDIKTGALLSPILRPRVPGTEGSDAVLEHFTTFFRTHLPHWSLTFQNSSSPIPHLDNKEVPFRNLIARRHPPWAASDGEVGYLTLVAHYDSKLEPEGFIGAIDSAAPCAMLMHVARSLEPALAKKWGSVDAVGVKMDDYGGSDDLEAHMGIQILFLDGEEAFGDWTNDDSIWGAKALAAEMEETVHPALSTYRNGIDAMELFVLLDLLGTKGSTVPSYFKMTHWAYKHLHDLAGRLDGDGLTETKAAAQWFPDFGKSEQGMWFGGGIGDDHLPFQEKGVDVLHLIPSPFPVGIWHQMEDDGEHLDLKTCRDWAVLMTGFAAEWLDLEGFMDGGKIKRERHRDELS